MRLLIFGFLAPIAKKIPVIKPIEPYVEQQNREQFPVDESFDSTGSSTDSTGDSIEYGSEYSLQNSGSHT